MATAKKKKHKRAGESMTGAEIAIQVIYDESVNTIFGYSGGAILPIYDAIFRWNKAFTKKKIELIVPANEQGASFMAAGYSRVSGKVGVAIVTSGPGATNCVTPIRDCTADSIPMVLVCGQVARAAIGSDAFQEAPVFNIMSACAKHVFLIEDPDELEATIRTAFHIARSGRPGPVVIDIPKDVQNTQVTFKGSGMLPLPGYQQRLDALNKSHVSKENAKAFYALLKNAKRPILLVGGGVINSNASAELRRFVKKFQIPTVTTLMGIGAIDTTDELTLHMLGMHGTAYANYAVEDCDLLISVGARFDDRVAGVPRKFAPGAKIAHIDIDGAEINKVKATDWHHVGDARTALKDLLAAGASVKLNHAAWRKKTKSLKRKHKLDFDRVRKVIQPQLVLETLNKLTKGDVIITTGVGQHQMFAAQYMDIKTPRTFITSGSMGTMGYGLPAAIGAQVAAKGKLVIDVDGDGSIRMNLGEMETCTNYDLPVKILLINNKCDGMVFQWQRLYFDARFSGTDKTLHMKNFVKAAQADGFKFSKRVEKKEDLKRVLSAFIKFDGPAFLEVIVDKEANVYPMVGPGMGYREMLTGPHIAARDQEIDTEATLDTSDSF